ncbi:sigma 54-interacting transcriptional regulator [Fredinandcohnia sp. QZ13]|uniref:sigma-54 interaction domain-containing protein n=1 Tax=Fredinandcohnia sp. QZ13 TaxID=3073144 RepID=UPI0028534E76|nr:sigma 54-interacting transcriptional regulator [Fredinandcohnia sp. QZ13]MDR4888125.1 sigma 54-interacting transcriptional regulator [Fredinandcohnia sp. QZ13]
MKQVELLKRKATEQLVNEVDVGIHVVDLEGTTIIYNQKMAQIEEMNQHDVLNKKLVDVFSFDKNEDSTLLQVLKNGEPIKNAKQTYYNNRGQEITTINNTIPIMDGRKQMGAMEIARDVTKLEKLLRENMNRRSDTHYTFDSIIGSSAAISEVIEASKRATRTNSSVLIIGDTGTGKELFAQSIHNGSNRSSAPFISQNCAALPDSLIEGILFGTKKGAFTGAIDRPGLFEQANGGTLLLDEINSLNPALQAKLLRVIQEKTVRRVGDTKDKKVDIRILATMNEDPIDAISKGRLRKDLYYRLSVVTLFIPPLRNRKEDVRELAYTFMEKYNHLFGLNVTKIEERVLQVFMQYDWPGNVRELEHIIEGALNVITYEDAISYNHLPLHFRKKTHSKPELATTANPKLTEKTDIQRLDEYMEGIETLYLKQVLQQCNNNITKTAEALGMSRQNLQYRLKKFGIQRDGSPSPM